MWNLLCSPGKPEHHDLLELSIDSGLAWQSEYTCICKALSSFTHMLHQFLEKHKSLSWPAVLRLGSALCLEIFQISCWGLLQLCFLCCIQWCRNCIGKGVPCSGSFCLFQLDISLPLQVLQAVTLCCISVVLQDRSVYSISSCTVRQEGKLPFMWVFLIFVWLLVLGWGFFFFYPCGIIFTQKGETSWIQDVVFHGCWAQCAFRFDLASRPGSDCPLRTSFLCLCCLHCYC